MEESFPQSSDSTPDPSPPNAGGLPPQNAKERVLGTPVLGTPQMRFGKIDDLVSRVAVAVDAARKFLFSQQHEEGYWCGELEADTTLESDYILLHTLLGTGNPERFEKAARDILQSSECRRRVEHLCRRAVEFSALR